MIVIARSLICALAAGLAGHALYAQTTISPPDSSLTRGCPSASRGGAAPALYDVSLVQLLATPERFEGCRVLVIGFVHLEFEGNAVYLHRDDFEANLLKNGLWVEFRPGVLKAAERYSDRYLILAGVFTQHVRGHMGLWSGALRDIERADPWPSRDSMVRKVRPPT